MEAKRASLILEKLNASSRNTLMEQLEIVYCAVGDDFLEASMPVTAKVHQPMGILHGGATAALVESVASAASALKIDLHTHYSVGMELSINHLSSVRSGQIIARAEAIHLGRSTHLWDIKVRESNGKLVAVSRLSMMVLEKS
jgi:1,4-dihydroxy-2-naphthoyl-CoA hydrolase